MLSHRGTKAGLLKRITKMVGEDTGHGMKDKE